MSKTRETASKNLETDRQDAWESSWPNQFSPRGPAYAESRGMKSIAFKVDGRNRDYIKASLIPANHSQESHFGLLDCAIVAFFLLCVGGLLYLLVG